MSGPAYDVVVVGAGPAGSAAALVAARAGSRVLLIERGEYAGSKNVSGAAFYAPQVLEALLPDFWRSAPVERHLSRRVITFVSPESSVSVDFATVNWAICASFTPPRGHIRPVTVAPACKSPKIRRMCAYENGPRSPRATSSRCEPCRS